MRLKKLQVSGFKTFVDPTDIRLPGNLVAVVGPNGCGKSNVIDAVRWVMGEVSAKMLRGENMADVIFNGSASRKPIGKATVELIFDNNDGKAGGSYGKFAEISVKRNLSRDGQSNYFINNIKSRRKDVLDLFRGTGLGSRPYSIIEQGMVSRIVDARPDDLRLFVEEAAGTSRYKDRRRETETRIKNTRENLDRVEDIRDELGKQLRRLQRQSAAARRYKVLKEEEREVDGQLQLLRLRAFESQLIEQDRQTAHFENLLEQALAEQRSTEAELETLRKHQARRQETNNRIQQEFYGVSAEIKNAEQRVEHLLETRKNQGDEIERLNISRTDRKKELESDNGRLTQYQQDIAAISLELSAEDRRFSVTEQQLGEAEGLLQQWQQGWEVFNRESQEPIRQQEVQQSRMTQLQQHLDQNIQRQQRLQDELKTFKQNISGLDIATLRQQVAAHDADLEHCEQAFHQKEQQIQLLRDSLNDKRDQSADLKVHQQEVASRLHSLQEIQAAALGGDDGELQQWLDQHDISGTARLANKISVRDGWERATDRVLNGLIGAICVADEDIPGVLQRPQSAVSLLTRRRAKTLPAHLTNEKLIDKVTAEDIDLTPLMADVYIAENLEQAVALQQDLFARDCVVTRDGTMVGANWISYPSESQTETGVLVREEEIKQLSDKLVAMEIEIEDFDSETEQLEQHRAKLEAELHQQRGQLNSLRADKTSLHNQLGRYEARLLEVEQRSRQVAIEIEELERQVEEDSTQIESAQKARDEAKRQSGSFEEQRNELLGEREQRQQKISVQRIKVNEVRDRRHLKQLQKQRMETATESVREHIVRVQQQFDADSHRLAEINRAMVESGDPVQDLRSNLDKLLQQREVAEKNFSSARDEMTGIENQIQQQNQDRTSHQQRVNESREALEQHKLHKQEIVVRKETQDEQILQHGYDKVALLAELPEQATTMDWQQKLSEILGKIERIGPVNLVAIEEFEEQSTRKEYLDKQHEDLVSALDTLESVIRKIDRETRSRFHETFEKLNAGFNEYFPQLFGGGKAELQLTSDDFLTAGVSVMAQPPGKRNSTIHLLSGGEKALTAVALLFSLFRLNPAPFCMLDEVDAPLDDANVDRYCNTLRKLCEISQIIVITHNKITMEQADLLVGVTMSEPGVSRLVSVDLDQAVEMVAQ